MFFDGTRKFKPQFPIFCWTDHHTNSDARWTQNQAKSCWTWKWELRFKKSHTTSDIVYVPINYIRNRHYDFVKWCFTKPCTTSVVVYVPINYIRNRHYDFVKWRFTKSYTTSDVVYLPVNYIRNRHYDFAKRRFTKSYLTSDQVHIPINYIRNCHYDFVKRRFSKSYTTSDVWWTCHHDLKSCFQFNHGNNNKWGFKPDQLMMPWWKDEHKFANYHNDKLKMLVVSCD